MSTDILGDFPPLLSDPAIRSAAISEFGLENTYEDPHLDAMCAFVARECGVPVALVSVVDTEEQRFFGRTGTVLTCTPRSTSFCATAMLQREIMIVPDAQQDTRFAHYTLVTGEPHIRFYAGVPLLSPEGIALGALCVIDVVPHNGLTDAQVQMLALMADAVMDRLLLRRAKLAEKAAADDAARALGESDLRFRILTDAMPQMVWSARADGHCDYFNARWYDYTGLPPGGSDGSAWTSALHPDDVDQTADAWTRSLATGAPYDLEYRLCRADGQYRWVLARGVPMRDVQGGIARWFGTCTDIHEQKLALEEREIVSQELSHRIKNIFAVIGGLVGLAARDEPSFADTADALRSRILALGRAHDFVRPHSRDSLPEKVKQDSLHGLLTQLFAPYEDEPGDRIHISGSDIKIDDRSATPLALLFHEVATNAAKYGALSTSQGKVNVSIEASPGETVEILWCETGGPKIDSAKKAGFGSQLLNLSVRRQLGGEYFQDWRPEGLVLRIAIPANAFTRRASV